jgi:hypothetical protein
MGYDLIARSVFVRVLLSHRRKFTQIVMLTWAQGLSAVSQSMVATVGEPLVILDDVGEFERRLMSVAPAAGQLMAPRRARRSASVTNMTAPLRPRSDK